VYSIESVGEPWKSIYALNPMVAVVEGFRWALAGGPPLDGRTAILSTVSALILLVVGLAYFQRTEKSFADVI
jgi:homopolymeric O-antigen transport system permease protein